MRIEAITIEAFRGFQKKHRFVFPNADVLLLNGPNGFGKTSFFDAIEWGLTGRIYRFEDDAERKQYRFIGNHFSDPTKPSVIIELKDRDNNQIHITRIGTAGLTSKTDSGSGLLKVSINGTQVPVELAEQKLYSLVVKDEWQNHVDINKSLFLTHLLCQERMNSILRGMKESERYDSLSALFGTDQFQRYRQLFQETKKKLEERQMNATHRKLLLSKQLETIEIDYSRLKEEIQEEETSDIRKNLSVMLRAYAAEYGCEWNLDNMAHYQEVFKELIQHQRALEDERTRIRQTEQRKSELAKAAVLSWKETAPKHKDTSVQIVYLEELQDMEQTLKKLSWLLNEQDKFQKAEETKKSILLLQQELLTKVELEKLRSEQLRHARDYFRKRLEDSYEKNDLYSSMRLSFLTVIDNLDSELRAGFLDAMQRIEDTYSVYKQKDQLVKEARVHYERCQKVAGQFEMHEKQHREFLQMVYDYASTRPDTHECPACGTPNIDAVHLLKHIEKKRNEIHPEFAELEEEVSKALQNLKGVETSFLTEKAHFQQSLTVADQFLQQKDEQVRTYRESNLRDLEQLDLYEKQIGLIGRSCEEFIHSAKKLDLEPAETTFRQNLETKHQFLQRTIQEKLALYPNLYLDALSGRLSECKTLLVKFQEEKTLFNNRMKEVGINIDESQETDLEVLQERIEFLQQEQIERITLLDKRETKIIQLQETYRTDTTVGRLQTLHAEIKLKEQEISSVDEEIEILNSYIEIALEVAQKVPEAVNKLNEKVMDQMFETMRSIFVRINSHPVFTEIDYDTDKKYNSNRYYSGTPVG